MIDWYDTVEECEELALWCTDIKSNLAKRMERVRKNIKLGKITPKKLPGE